MGGSFRRVTVNHKAANVSAQSLGQKAALIDSD